MAEQNKGLAGIFNDPNFITGVSILAANSDPTRHWSEGYRDASERLSAMERSALNRAEMELRKQRFEQEQQAMEAQRAAQERLRERLAGATTPQEIGMALMTEGSGGQISTGAQLYGARGPELPASIREFEYVQGLPEDQREAYMRMQQGAGPDPYFTPVPTAEGVMLLNTRTGKITEPDIPVLRATEDPDLQAELAGAKTQGKGEAEASLEAKAALPQLAVTTKNIEDSINYIENNMNTFRAATGPMGSRIPARSGAATNMNAQLDFLEAQVIPQAAAQLRGLGPMSEYELDAVSRSISKLNRQQSPEAYLKGAKDFLQLVKNMSASKTAQINQPSGASREPNTSLIEEADRIIGGGQ